MWFEWIEKNSIFNDEKTQSEPHTHTRREASFQSGEKIWEISIAESLTMYSYKLQFKWWQHTYADREFRDLENRRIL